MNRIELVFILLFATCSMQAQNIFDKFSGQDNIESVVVNKKMFELMSKVKVDVSDKEAQLYINFIKKIDNLRAFTTTDADASGEMKVTANNYIKSAGLEELVQVNDNGKNTRIFVKHNGSAGKIKEFFMFIDDSKKSNGTVLLSLTGNFDLEEIPILTDRMKISGAEGLKKILKAKQ